MPKLYFFWFLTVLLSGSAQADIYKCTGNTGTTVYSQTPCATDAAAFTADGHGLRVKPKFGVGAIKPGGGGDEQPAIETDLEAPLTTDIKPPSTSLPNRRSTQQRYQETLAAHHARWCGEYTAIRNSYLLRQQRLAAGTAQPPQDAADALRQQFLALQIQHYQSRMAEHCGR